MKQPWWNLYKNKKILAFKRLWKEKFVGLNWVLIVEF